MGPRAGYPTPMLTRIAVGSLLGAVLLAACATTDPTDLPTPVEPSVAASASAAPSVVPSVGAEPWEQLDDAPFARLEMAVAAHDGRIWLAGGLTALGNALIDVDIYDPASATWSDGPALPGPIHHAALVSDGERLVLIGGYRGSAFNLPTDQVLVLDDAAGAWEPIDPLPEARAAGAAAWDGERIVYAGGVGAAGVVADVYALDGEDWARIGSMVQVREHLSAVSDGAGTTWLLGGRVETLTTNTALVEAVVGTTIDAIGELPTGRGGTAAFHHPSRGACLTGGEAPEHAFTLVECISASGVISLLPELNEPHHGHGVGVIDGVAYVMLGGPQPLLVAGSTVESLVLGE